MPHSNYRKMIAHFIPILRAVWVACSNCLLTFDVLFFSFMKKRIYFTPNFEKLSVCIMGQVASQISVKKKKLVTLVLSKTWSSTNI